MSQMNQVTVACMQPRFSILASSKGFEALARRFLRQARINSAQLGLFPELTGVFLAPPLMSRLKLKLATQADRGRKPGAGFFAKRIGHVTDSAAGVLGWGLAGSLRQLLASKSDSLRDLYVETFGRLAREFDMYLVGGSLYVYDAETESVRNRAYLFDKAGAVVGWQDKLNLTPAEQKWVTPGTGLAAFALPFGRLGILIGWDVLYPELARVLAVQGTDLLAGIAAVPGTAQGDLVRTALHLRVQENQVFAAASFMLGPGPLDQDAAVDCAGQSALLAPIALTPQTSGILAQVGSPQAESAVSAAMDFDGLRRLQQTSPFRPRQQMNLGNQGSVLAEMYRRGMSVEQAIEQGIAAIPEAPPSQSQEEGPAAAQSGDVALPQRAHGADEQQPTPLGG
jgi:predicted amidohydrolase